mgnify:CR=1 FL=1
MGEICEGPPPWSGPAEPPFWRTVEPGASSRSSVPMISWRTPSTAGWSISRLEAPPGTTDNPKSYWFEQEYACFNDLPDIGVRVGGRKCRATPGSGGSTNAWCTEY